MAIDRIGDLWSGSTYKGFSGGPAVPPEPPRGPPGPVSPRRAPSTRILMLAGGGGALALGVLFGLWARPELIGSTPAPSVTPPGAEQASIAVSPPSAAEPPPRAPSRLQTLPPDTAAAARPQAAPSAAAPQTPEAAPMPMPMPMPRMRASFDCATARPGAEELVCGDAGLAVADRQMARAYLRAMRSGVDPEELRQEQRDWMAIREDAARRSPQALAQVYDQRIQDLNRISQNAPGDGEGE